MGVEQAERSKSKQKTTRRDKGNARRRNNSIKALSLCQAKPFGTPRRAKECWTDSGRGMGVWTGPVRHWAGIDGIDDAAPAGEDDRGAFWT